MYLIEKVRSISFEYAVIIPPAAQGSCYDAVNKP